jgi:hypothetical protein
MRYTKEELSEFGFSQDKEKNKEKYKHYMMSELVNGFCEGCLYSHDIEVLDYKECFDSGGNLKILTKEHGWQLYTRRYEIGSFFANGEEIKECDFDLRGGIILILGEDRHEKKIGRWEIEQYIKLMVEGAIKIPTPKEVIAVDENESRVDLSYNFITDKELTAIVDELVKMPNLYSINLDHNEITDVSQFERLSNKIECLFLGNNKIADPSPLSAMVCLETLHLECNNIKDPMLLASLASLTKLDDIKTCKNGMPAEYEAEIVGKLATQAYLQTLRGGVK